MKERNRLVLKTKASARLLATLLILSHCISIASALAPVDEGALRNAWSLYTQKKYAAAADAFENLIRTSTPNARLYYYAAAANKSSNRLARAKQLCDYVIANFPKSTEASYAQQLLPDTATQTASDDLPESLKGKKLEELMQTEEGRRALKEALKKKPGAAATATASATTTTTVSTPRSSDTPFTVEDIAKDGAAGITQFISRPDCLLECSMVALASNPRGQKLLSEMIRTPGAKGTYVIRLPGDGVEHTITPEKLDMYRVRDKALWATLIHLAMALRVHSKGSGNLEDSLGFLTGKRVDKIHASNTTEQALTLFIRDAVKAQNPIVCEAAEDFGTLPALVESEQCYTITDFDEASKMITIRNPHGANSRRFRVPEGDPNVKKFEQLNDGTFRLHVTLFPKYFSTVARSSY